jgi:predicted anti-sigma-YlaC factor YlaD
MKTLIACLAITLLSGCSVKRMAVNKLGDALASGGDTFQTDDDPDLVGQAVPFSLKLMESLLAESPKHKGLLLAASSGFTAYSYAFVDEVADETAGQSLDKSDALRARAARLYLRAHRFGLRALEVNYPGIGAALDGSGRVAALKKTRKQDVPLLYWTAASLGLAVSASRDNAEMIARLPMVEAMVDRVLDLDESWGQGSVQEFLMSIESIRPGIKPDEQKARLKKFYDRALALSGGGHASTYVSYAENASVPAQNLAEFRSLLGKALEIDTDAKPESRLANLVAQRRARWLLSRTDELFVEAEPRP